MVKSSDICDYMVLTNLYFAVVTCFMIRKPLDANPTNVSIKIRAARLFSDIFSPPSAFAMFGFITAWSTMSFWRGSVHAIIFGSLSSLLPLGYILLQMKRGVIDDIHLGNSEDRKIPYIIGVLGAVIAYFVLRMMETSGIFLNYILINIIGLISLWGINSRWLISAHTSTITAIVTFSGIAISPQVGLALSPLVILTITIRYYLKRHTVLELASGFFVGVISVLLLVIFGLFDGT
jgi:hypothetical protein